MKSGSNILGKKTDHKPSIYAGLWSFDLCDDNILITELFFWDSIKKASHLNLHLRILSIILLFHLGLYIGKSIS